MDEMYTRTHAHVRVRMGRESVFVFAQENRQQQHRFHLNTICSTHKITSSPTPILICFYFQPRALMIFAFISICL